MDQQDVITFEPAPIKAMFEEKGMEAFDNPDFHPIFKALRQGPMTVREIVAAYNFIAKRSKKFEPKSDKTIYRYLKTLEEADLVVPAGQRVTIGKTATETLYARTAKLFLRFGKSRDCWESDLGAKIVNRLGVLLQSLYEMELKSVDCLRDFLCQMEEIADEEMTRLFKIGDDETVQHLMNMEDVELSPAFHYLYMLIPLLKDPSIVEKSKECFKKAKSR